MNWRGALIALLGVPGVAILAGLLAWGFNSHHILIAAIITSFVLLLIFWLWERRH
jgi:hypothetical protein